MTVLKVALIAFIIIAGLGFGTAQRVITAIRRAAHHRGLFRRPGGGAVGLRRVEQRQHGGLRGPRPAAQPAARADLGNRCGNRHLFTGKCRVFSRSHAGEVGASPRVAAEMMRRILGGPGASAVSVAAMISIFAALNGSILSGSRVPYAAARDGYFFRAIGRVHPAYHTPSRIDSGAERVGRAAGALRAIRTTFHLCDFRELDSVRHDHRGGDRAAEKAAGSAAAVPHAGISVGSGTVRAGGVCFSTFTLIGFPARIADGNWVDYSGTSFLFLLEKTMRTEPLGTAVLVLTFGTMVRINWPFKFDRFS